MKNVLLSLLIVTSINLTITPVFANDINLSFNISNNIKQSSNNVEPKSILQNSFAKDGLTINSYTKTWSLPMLKNLYNEFLKNFHSDEISYLSTINIYGNSPYGVNGHYYDDVSLMSNGKYHIGKNAYINLYNGDIYNSPKEIAPILSHEYGHHYMIYYLVKNENVYYSNVTSSKYAKIRGLNNSKMPLNPNDKNYLYHYDLMEIMADDYLQLLGSPNAKISINYKSIDELKKANKFPIFNPRSFNAKPQLNPNLPLASEVSGLYQYMLKLSGYTASSLIRPKSPSISDIYPVVDESNLVSYNAVIKYPKGLGAKDEYTLVMYPKNNAYVANPLKTFTSNNTKIIKFGSYLIKTKDTALPVIEKYEGVYEFRFYIKILSGFIFKSEPTLYDFTKGKFIK